MKYLLLLILPLPLMASLEFAPKRENLNLTTISDNYQDVLSDWSEIPSRIYKRNQVKEFLSSTNAKELRKDLGTFRDEMIEKFLKEAKSSNPDYFSLSKEITQKYLSWIRKY